MMKPPVSKAEDRLFFRDPDRWLGPLDAAASAALASAAGDVTLLIDSEGVIRDASESARAVPGLADWIGKMWVDTVTVESRPKVDDMLANGAAHKWRQVNHPSDAADVPVKYKAFRLGHGGTLAIGRDERAAAQLQQRLLQVQQSLERDYLRLRQAEARYRLLFELTTEPMLIVDAATLRIREANPAALDMIAAPHSLTGQPLVAQVAAADRDRLIAFLGAASTGVETQPVSVTVAKSERSVSLSARLFRQEGASYYLVQVHAHDLDAMEPTERLTLDLIERLPDAFVLTDANLAIVSANAAFGDMVHAAALPQLTGRPLADFLGRPGIDLDLILAQLKEHDAVRNVATILRGVDGADEEVEASAVRIGAEPTHFGFTFRVVARRLRDLPPPERDLPRSVEQLTELVGRVPLKDIVRESTDLIERLCIEAALSYTSNNRASAAEILGLSRQSLYSKLHRHGLAKIEGDEAAE
jgi:transcriptional regulator PpsR